MGKTVARKTRTSAPLLSPLALAILAAAMLIGALQGGGSSSASSHVSDTTESVTITNADVAVTDTYIDEGSPGNPFGGEADESSSTTPTLSAASEPSASM
ncbi:MAG: hypothetical protein U5Q44_13435 [Dehalococcoidia bacterium]|nr:hypothetical protein [Dehalococcoidia bacterium]